MGNYVALLQALKLVDHQGVRTLRKTASQRVLADLVGNRSQRKSALSQSASSEQRVSGAAK